MCLYLLDAPLGSAKVAASFRLRSRCSWNETTGLQVIIRTHVTLTISHTGHVRIPCLVQSVQTPIDLMSDTIPGSFNGRQTGVSCVPF